MSDNIRSASSSNPAYKANGRGIFISGSLSFIAGEGGAQREELRLRADSLWSILSTAGGCFRFRWEGRNVGGRFDVCEIMR